MRLLIMTLILLLPTQAFAAYGGWAFSPPKRFEGKPPMPYTIIALPVTKIAKYCSAYKRFYNIVYGCAAIRDKPKKHCVVFIPDKSLPNLAWPIGGVLIIKPEMIFKHELAHCNGWPKDHSR